MTIISGLKNLLWKFRSLRIHISVTANLVLSDFPFRKLPGAAIMDLFNFQKNEYTSKYYLG